MSSYATYARFYAEAQAAELRAFLEGKGIAYVMEKDRPVLDKIYAGENLESMVNLKIPSEDFLRVNDLIVHEFPVDEEQVAKDYYLYTFSPQELLDVIHGNGDWNYFDRALAARILERQHIPITAEVATPESFRPYHVGPGMLLLEYMAAVVFSYAGIIIGIATLAAYKTAGDGTKMKMYDSVTRTHARIWLVIGVIRSTIFLVWTPREWLGL